MQTPSRKVTYNPESSRKHDHQCVCQICTCGKYPLIQANTPVLNRKPPLMPTPVIKETTNLTRWPNRLQMQENTCIQRDIMTLECSNRPMERTTRRCQSRQKRKSNLQWSIGPTVENSKDNQSTRRVMYPAKSRRKGQSLL